MVLTAFTVFHVILSLVGIGSGLVVLYGLLTSRWFERWTIVFLTTTVATSVTGFLFPVHKFLPSHGVGILSLILLSIAICARSVFHLAGAWRRTYVVTATLALYLNSFVLVAQLFQKVPPLKALAPTQSESPFKIAQLVVLVIFAVAGARAAIKFRENPLRTT